VHGLQYSPDLLEASLAGAPGVIVAAFGRVRRALRPSRLGRDRFLAALVPVVGLLDLAALGLETVRGETGACALPGAASLGGAGLIVVGVLVVVAAAFCAGCQLERVIDACADDPDTRTARTPATSRAFM
jgi:hypothetical protein